QSNTGEAAGIGSRYFSVSNSSGLRFDANPAAALSFIAAAATLDLPPAVAARIANPHALEAEIDRAPPDPGSILGRRGFDPKAAVRSYRADAGTITVHSEELSPVELHLGATGDHRYT